MIFDAAAAFASAAAAIFDEMLLSLSAADYYDTLLATPPMILPFVASSY